MDHIWAFNCSDFSERLREANWTCRTGLEELGVSPSQLSLFGLHGSPREASGENRHQLNIHLLCRG